MGLTVSDKLYEDLKQDLITPQLDGFIKNCMKTLNMTLSYPNRVDLRHQGTAQTGRRQIELQLLKLGSF